MILCSCACKPGTYVYLGIILSTQNSSDIDLVKDIVSANKVTICYSHCISFFTN